MTTYLRDYHHTTGNCLDHLADTGLVGRVHAVEGGYILRRPEEDRFSGLYNCPHQAIAVHGSKGSVLYTALGWGYGGEGARGLHGLLDHLGMDGDAAWVLVTEKLALPIGPDLSAFGGKPGFLRYWRIQVPSWALESI